MSDYSKMTIAQLKEELKKQGLPVSGTKQVLIDRLNENAEEKEEEEEEEEEEEVKPTKKSAALKRKADDEEAENQPETKKKKAAIKVDDTCTLTNAEVVDNWGAMLNQTNIGNNNNKFYVIQVLKQGSNYYCYTRWGRVEEHGQRALASFGTSLAGAQNEFKKKFKAKTKNDWDVVSKDFSKFKSYPNLYTLLEMSYEDDDVEQIQEALSSLKEKRVKEAQKIKPSRLPKETQELINLIFDLDMFKQQMAKFELNVKELPLGKLSAAQVNKGFAVLEKISDAINKGGRADFAALCSEFYTVIPHAFGRRVPPVFKDAESVQQKKDMLSVLSDIALAQELTKKGEAKDKAEEATETEYVDNPIDKNYDLLNADIEPLDKKSHEYDVIVKYLNATMGDYRKLQLMDIFKVTRQSEPARFAQHEDIVERKLLWHGTNVAVLVAILSTGLRIMPHSGGRVGKGIYFASENSKSAGYVGTTSDNIGFMFLNEVAIGKSHIITRDDSSLRVAPKGCDSIIAKGWTEPDPKQDTILKLDGHDVVVPQGKPTKQAEYTSSSFSQSEYLIYKESQNQIRYLLKLKGF